MAMVQGFYLLWVFIKSIVKPILSYHLVLRLEREY
ncbi:unnamed protein product [Brassica rapa]|uniref:Uncharacterized protein n=2 Tax=Brassica TaxID=3705 RepID=A0A8D9GG00_BRACM|nr:unnamed protein product [Brassica napus]CAG7879928.1 unnamed protein product [Brassica rapa]